MSDPRETDLPPPDILYPDTTFIDSYLQNEYECDLARLMYVTDFFADGNSLVRRWLSSVAALEVFDSEPSRQQRVTDAASRISDLMQTSLSLLLAKGGQDSGDPGFNPSAIESKSRKLVRTWGLIQSSPLNMLRSTDDENEPSSSGSIDVLRHMTLHDQDLGSAILYLDFLRLDPAREDSLDRRESKFREAVLRTDTTTGIPIFDEYFGTVAKLVQAGFYDAGLKEVQERWKQWHRGQEFFPKGFPKADHVVPEVFPSSGHPIRSIWSRVNISRSSWRTVQAELEAGAANEPDDEVYEN